jgi:hypothetical protein
MWTCPRCGEQHEDQFSDCWKCAGLAEQGQFSAKPLPPLQTEQRLKPLSAFIKVALIAFGVGVVLSMLFTSVVDLHQLVQSWPELSLLGTSVLSLVAGVGLGIIAGVFAWVVFPYEPIDRPPS